jgi:peptidoglycan/xylan/chitin deacetylase (PgdA/CDA1 family)
MREPAPRPRRIPAGIPLRSLAGVLTLAFVVLVVLAAPPRHGWFTPADDETVAMAAQQTTGPVTSFVPQIPPPREIVTPTPAPTPSPTPAAEFITYTSSGDGEQANELGRIPILMYHGFTHDLAYTDEWTLTYDQFRDQLDWLVANDFVMIGLNNVIDRNIAIPAGKRPVVLTFDDASSGQFRLREAKGGGFEVNPDTAVGILEEYRKTYPEFAGPAFFAVLPYNCFANEDDPSTCEDRLTWLIEHDYEVGNHTMGHQNLTDVSIDVCKSQIVDPVTWLDERIQGPNDLSDVLVLPFGAYPARENFRELLFDGFWLEGEYFVPRLVLEVGGGPARAPYHVEWATNLTRYNTHPDVFQYWADQIESGEMAIYVSDGSAETVTVPEGWIGALDQDRVREDGRRIIVQMTDPATPTS